jgi:hypothetical protein
VDVPVHVVAGEDVGVSEPKPLNPTEQDALVKQIGLTLMRAAPEGWRQVSAEYRATGRYFELAAEVHTADGSVHGWAPPQDVATLFARLRAGMHREGRGSWSNARYQLDHPSSYNLDFDRAEPQWQTPPPQQAYFDEMRFFPRSEENVPDWLRRRLGQPAQPPSAPMAAPPVQLPPPPAPPAPLAPPPPAPPRGFRTARVFDGAGPDGRPSVNRPPVPEQERDALLDYLDHAPVVVAGRGFDADVLDHAVPLVVPVAFQTDGHWIWPAAVGYYLRTYGIPPENDLVERIRSTGHRLPEVAEEARIAAAANLGAPPAPRGTPLPMPPAPVEEVPEPVSAQDTATDLRYDPQDELPGEIAHHADDQQHGEHSRGDHTHGDHTHEVPVDHRDDQGLLHAEDPRGDAGHPDDPHRDDPRHEDLRHEDLRHEDLRADDLHRDDLRHDDLRHDDLHPDDLHGGDLRQDGPHPDDLRHDDPRHDDLRHDDLRGGDVRQDGLDQHGLDQRHLAHDEFGEHLDEVRRDELGNEIGDDIPPARGEEIVESLPLLTHGRENEHHDLHDEHLLDEGEPEAVEETANLVDLQPALDEHQPDDRSDQPEHGELLTHFEQAQFDQSQFDQGQDGPPYRVRFDTEADVETTVATRAHDDRYQRDSYVDGMDLFAPHDFDRAQDTGEWTPFADDSGHDVPAAAEHDAGGRGAVDPDATAAHDVVPDPEAGRRRRVVESDDEELVQPEVPLVAVGRPDQTATFDVRQEVFGQEGFAQEGFVQEEHAPEPERPRQPTPDEERELGGLRRALDDLDVPPAAYRFGEQADRTWCVRTAGEGWEVAWIDRGVHNPVRFDRLDDASAFLVGKLVLTGRRVPRPVLPPQGMTSQGLPLQPQGLQNQGPQNQGPQNQGPQNQGPQPQGPQNQGPQPQGPQNQGPPRGPRPPMPAEHVNGVNGFRDDGRRPAMPPRPAEPPRPEPARVEPARAEQQGADSSQSSNRTWPIQPMNGEPPLTLFRQKKMVELAPGTEVDRFGDPDGNLAYSAGTPFEERSLVPSWINRTYRVYRLRRPVEVLTGVAVPWFEQPGGGTAYLFPRTIEDMLAEGSLVEVTEDANASG